MDMVERVAAAIYDAYGFAYEGRTILANGKPYGEWAVAMKAANAAIEAMRQPTEWMLDCGACYEDPDQHYTKGPMKDEGDLSKDVWSAMISAALNEPVESR